MAALRPHLGPGQEGGRSSSHAYSYRSTVPRVDGASKKGLWASGDLREPSFWSTGLGSASYLQGAQSEHRGVVLAGADAAGSLQTAGSLRRGSPRPGAVPGGFLPPEARRDSVPALGGQYSLDTSTRRGATRYETTSQVCGRDCRLSGLSRGCRRLVLRSLVSIGAGAKGSGQEAVCVLGRRQTLGSATTRLRAGLGTTGGHALACAPHYSGCSGSEAANTTASSPATHPSTQSAKEPKRTPPRLTGAWHTRAHRGLLRRDSAHFPRTTTPSGLNLLVPRVKKHLGDPGQKGPGTEPETRAQRHACG